MVNNNKVEVVTGGNSGIGLATANAFKETGIKSESGSIDYLVNNAILLSCRTVLDLEEEDWDHVMNVKGNFLCSKYAIL